jgi:hypothetical protein
MDSLAEEEEEVPLNVVDCQAAAHVRVRLGHKHLQQIKKQRDE